MRTLNIIERGFCGIVASIETEETNEERLQAMAMALIEKDIGKIAYADGQYKVVGTSPIVPYFRVGSTMSWEVFKTDGAPLGCCYGPHFYQYDIIEKGKN